MQDTIRRLLSELGEDPTREGLVETPRRVEQSLRALTSGYTADVNAVINGAQKCLRRGQYCSHSADRQYHRYGFHCHKRDSYGSYHLT